MSNTLQIAFIALGVLIVALVWAYNFFQERKLRREHLKHFQETSLSPEPSMTIVEERKIEPRLLSSQDTRRNDEEKPDPRFEATWRLEFSKPVMAAELPLQRFQIPSMVRLWGEEESGKSMALVGDLQEEATHHKIKALIGALPLMEGKAVATPEALKNFLNLGREIAEMTAAAFGYEEIDSWLAKAARLSSWVQDMDIEFTIYLKVTDGQGVVATKVRSLLEASGFRLEEDGLCRLRNEQGAVLIAAHALGGFFSKESILAQHIPGLALSMVVPLLQDPLDTYRHLLKLAERWQDPLGVEMVNELGAKITAEDFDAVRLEIVNLLALMHERDIEPGSKRAFRLFGS
jgi:hypothetical protein